MIFDFSKLSARWARTAELSHYYNASSIIPEQVEPYLLAVVTATREVVLAKAPHLREEIELFFKQESHHYRIHREFNKRLEELGYSGIRKLGELLREDLSQFRKTRSLKFNCAYADAFEALGVVGAHVFFDRLDDYLQGADPEVVRFWKWHLAEEYEHRRVCFSIYKTLFGGGWDKGYFYRLGVFIYAMKHFGGYVRRIADELLAVDRAAMSPQSCLDSERRQFRFQLTVARRSFKHIVAALMPGYDPARVKPPKRLSEFLATGSAASRSSEGVATERHVQGR